MNLRIKGFFLCLLVTASCTGVADEAPAPLMDAFSAIPKMSFIWTTTPKLPENVASDLHLGYQAALAKRYTEAFGYLDRAIKADPTSSALLMRGRVYLSLGQYRAAVDDLTLALAKDPRFVDALLVRGYAYFYLNDFPDALADFSAALALKPDVNIAHIGHGVVLAYTKEYRKAADDFAWVAKRSAATDKVDAAKYFRVAAELYGLGHRKEEALASIDAAIALAPDMADLYVVRGGFETDEYGKSLMDYETAIRLNPGAVYARYRLAVLLHRMSQYQASLDEFNELLGTPQRDANFYVSRGYLLMDMDRDGDALLDNERAAKLDPSAYRVVDQRMQLRFYQGDYAGVVRDADMWLSTHDKADETDVEYALMWRHISTQRTGADDRSYMVAAIASIKDRSAWPYPLIEYAAGKLNEWGLRVASTHGDPKQMQQRQCETEAYVAERYLSHNQRGLAEERFRHALAICPQDFAERTLAERTLKSFTGATVRDRAGLGSNSPLAKAPVADTRDKPH
jgi:tetratricopeptide (TPR) repeat protein